MPESVASAWNETLDFLKNHLKDIDEKMLAIIEASKKLKEKFEHLQTIPGIAQTTALAILAEIEKVDKFLSARQLAAYIGVTPKHKESGTSVHFKPSISKIGSPFLRKALYFPAVTAIRCNKTFAKFAKKLEARKKSAKQIIVAIMRKIIHAIFGILKNNSVFNEKSLFKCV